VRTCCTGKEAKKVVSLSWLLVAIIDAFVLRSSYKDKPIGVRDTWLRSAERSEWIAPMIPDPSTRNDSPFRTQAEGASFIRERKT
jgi:hypothetical protein